MSTGSLLFRSFRHPKWTILLFSVLTFTYTCQKSVFTSYFRHHSLANASDAFPSTAPLPGPTLSRDVCTAGHAQIDGDFVGFGHAQIEISLPFTATR